MTPSVLCLILGVYSKVPLRNLQYGKEIMYSDNHEARQRCHGGREGLIKCCKPYEGSVDLLFAWTTQMEIAVELKIDIS